MEDFATFCKQNKNKRLTKNRFWNLIFWGGMSFGFAVALFTKSTLQMSIFGSTIMWCTLLGVPLLIVLANKTRFTKNNTFVNSENIELTKKQLPTSNFIWMTIVGVGFTFLIAEVILPQQPLGFFSALIFFSCLFSGFCLYFIFKNCPISILFNLKCWHYLAENSPTRTNKFSSRPNARFLSNLSTLNDRNNIVTNPAYKSLSCNIYNRRHR